MRREDISSEVASALLNVEAVKLSPAAPFTWASGWKSPIYCDNRKVLSDVEGRGIVVDNLGDLIEELYFDGVSYTFDVIAGVATGAIAWGSLVAQEFEVPFAYIRAKAKDHGLENRIEGVIKPGQRVLVIEDLISTGSSSLSAVEAVRQAGGEVVGMAAIFSYQFEKATKAFAEAGVKLDTLSNYPDLIETAVKTGYVAEEQLELLAQWRENPSEWGK